MMVLGGIPEPVLWALNVLFQSVVISIFAICISRFFCRTAVVRRAILASGVTWLLITPFVASLWNIANTSLFSLALLTHTHAHESKPLLASSATPRQDNNDQSTAIAAPGNRSHQIGEINALVPTGCVLHYGAVLVAATWVSGTGISLIGLALAWRKTCVLRSSAVRLHDGYVVGLMHAIGRTVGNTSSICVAESSEIRVPIVIGLLRPLILLPKSSHCTLRQQDLQAVLLHEAAHVIMGDQRLLFLQELVAAIFWMNPFIQQLNRDLARAREEVCDNYALNEFGPLAYGHTLLRVASSLEVNAIATTSSIWSSDWTLEERIRGILDARRNTMRRIGFGAMVTIMATVGAFGTAVGAIRVIEDASVAKEKETDSRSDAGGRKENGHKPDPVVIPPEGVTLHIEFWVFDLTANQALWDEFQQQSENDGSPDLIRRARSGSAAPKCMSVVAPFQSNRVTNVRRDFGKSYISASITNADRDGAKYLIGINLEGADQDPSGMAFRSSFHRDCQLRLGDSKVFGRKTFELLDKRGKLFLRYVVVWRVTALITSPV
jgi:beta-lactamase regulating signal transducer with metallopeptidase domain